MTGPSASLAPASLRSERNATSAGSFVARLLLLALAYFVGARLGALLSIPPGYASAFWLPAGLALMALLTGGLRFWPGVFIGSFAHNMLVSTGTGSGALETALVSLALGTGASLQAVVGATLVRRYVGYPTSLTGVRETVRFLMLSGPVSCVVSASIGVGALAARAVIPPDSIAFSWFNWWVGDAIGVLLAVPCWLVAAGEPRAFWRGRWLTVAAPVLAMVVVALGAFAIAQRQENARIHTEFAARADELKRRIADVVEDDIVLLDTVSGHLDALPSADATSFATVTRSVIARHGSLRAIEWAPVVTAAQRAAFERAAAGSGLREFTITERGAAGTLAPSAARERYVPVRYVEPLGGNESALGFDLASDPSRREAIEAAAKGGAAVLSRPVHLVQAARGATGLLAVMPVYREPRTATPTADAAVGFVVGVITVSRLIDAAVADLDLTGLSYRLVDVANARQPLPLFEHRQSTQLAFEHETSAAALQELAVSAAVPVPGRQWRLETHPTLTFLANARTPMPWIIQISGLLFAALIGTLLLNLSGRKEEVIQEVALRTRELSERNRQLLHEISERERAQSALKQSEERYRALIEQAPLMVAIARDNRFVYANARFLAAHKLDSLEAIVGTPVIERVAPSDRAVWAARAAARLRGLPADRTYEMLACRTDGTEIPIVAFVDMVELPDGPAVIGFFEDQSERLALASARRESEARFEAAFENSANGMSIEDRAGHIQRVNPAMCSLLGYARAELLTRNLCDLTYPDDAAGSAERAEALWTGAVGSYQHEKRYVHKDGHPVWVGVSCALIRDEQGRPRYLVLQARDLSERERLERALLEATNNEQQRLGHELHDGLGQELTGMSMLVAALAGSERKAGRPVPRNLAELERVAQRTIATCRAIAHGLSPLSYVRGDLVEALRELVALQHQAYGARTHFDSIGSAQLTLPADARDHLYRIAQEAISNARRHAEACSIDVRLTVEPAYVRLEIVDDGQGLTLPGGGSPGMGLKIMQYRAGMIGATLSIGSGSDGGTHITCECPQALRSASPGDAV